MVRSVSTGLGSVGREAVERGTVGLGDVEGRDGAAERGAVEFGTGARHCGARRRGGGVEWRVCGKVVNTQLCLAKYDTACACVCV